MWLGEVPSHAQREDVRDSLKRMGWTPEQVSCELSAMQALRRMNTTDGNSFELSMKYVLDFIEPHDVVAAGGAVLICQAEARA